MKRTYLTLIIIMLVIGFASVATNLAINGTINFGFNEDEFNVYFSYARIDANESDEIISDDKQNITFTTSKLTDVNQTSTLYYEVTNNSKQYDASVEITCDEGTELYSIDNTLANTTIKARSVSKGKVTVTLNKISTEDKEIEFKCHLNVTAISRSEEENKEVPEICHYDEGFEWDFDYTGGEQEFTVPCNGTYKLEVWGAQGGSYSSITQLTGGLGGYSVGDYQTTSNTTLYVNVGGRGENMKSTGISNGGYNGGGYGNNTGQHGTGGGGATHIALVTGVLSNLENNLNQVLIVAGGGGGNGGGNLGALAGNGGGLSGGTGINSTVGSSRFIGIGATQTQAGDDHTFPNNTAKGSFGKGGNNHDDLSKSCDVIEQGGCGGSGGGGGLYGGGGSSRGHAGAGGGSGYIGNLLLTNKGMWCSDCETSEDVDTKTTSTENVSVEPISQYAKQGNGYAKITLISIEN